MRAEVLLLCVAVLSTNCASLPQALKRSGSLGYMPRGATRPVLTQQPDDEPPHGPVSPSRVVAGPGVVERRLYRRVEPRGDTAAAPGGMAGDTVMRASQVRQEVLDAVDDVKDSTDRMASALARLEARPPQLGNMDRLLTGYVTYGTNQVPWLRGGLGGATALVAIAEGVADSDMELGILRMTGPRLQATLFGSMLLATWSDFLHLTDAMLRQCLVCSGEKLYTDMYRVQRLIEPTMAELASLEPERVEAAATAMPALMGQLSREYGALREYARTSFEMGGKVMVAAQVLEMVNMVSLLKMSLPRLPPAAPATLGMGFVMSSGNVMVGSQLVVSAEWVEMMRRLVQAGVISVPVVSAAIRIHGGQVMMAQAHQDLPEGVREALGDSPEVRGMHVTGKAGAGMSEAPKHHVLPKEHREWFEQRGFKGDMDIDQFCVRLERSHHEAIHGGGDWRMGRTWPGEWSQMLMRTLRAAETKAGRMLNRNEILAIVAENMKEYRVPMNFVTGRSR